MHWLCIGGGPSACDWASQPYSPDVDVVATSNRGLTWCAKPDVYWVTDPNAIARYHHLYTSYEGEIICNVPLWRETTHWDYYSKGPLYHGRSSGICIMRVALARGATQISLVGYDGHKPGDALRDAADRPYATYGSQAGERNEAMSKSLWDMATNYPEVKFVFFGRTLLDLPTLENWTHHV